jgi:putative PIN family toxin of toxin-antitoxin system
VKAVFDTNVLFAASISPGLCSKLLIRARRRDCHLVMCPEIRAELLRVLANKLHAPPTEAQHAVQLVDEAVDSACTPLGAVSGVCRDTSDDHVLDCLQASGADYLVTGDADLLTLKEFGGARILTPREFELLFSD